MELGWYERGGDRKAVGERGVWKMKIIGETGGKR
jgi:hypothetical protein